MTIISAAKQEQIARLGVNGPARVDAVTAWLKAVGGSDAETLIKVMDYAPHAGTVQAFERMMARFKSQGAMGFDQRHRNGGEEGLSDAQYEAMSYSDRREYQRQHSGRR